LKKILILILTLTSLFSIGIVASAFGPGSGYPPPPPPHHGFHPGDQMEARRVLDETRDYIFQAQRVADRYQQQNLRRAFGLQADGREFYRQWRYDRAIRLSYRAREIAQDIIESAERRELPPPPRRHHQDGEGDSSIHIRLNL
jgi:hypothetical protein